MLIAVLDSNKGTQYKIEVASHKVPVGFPEYAAIDLQDSVDISQLDQKQMFMCSVLLSAGVLSQQMLIGDDPLDEAGAVQLLTLQGMADELKQPMQVQQRLIDRLLAYPGALQDDKDADELAEYVPEIRRVVLENRRSKLLTTMRSDRLYYILCGGFPTKLFDNSGEETVYIGDSSSLMKNVRSRFNTLYAACVKGVITKSEAAHAVRNIFKVLRDAKLRAVHNDLSAFAVDGVTPDQLACVEIADIVWEHYARMVRRFAVMYLLDSHRDAFPLPVDNMALAQENVRKLYSALTRADVPEFSVILVL